MTGILSQYIVRLRTLSSRQRAPARARLWYTYAVRPQCLACAWQASAKVNFRQVEWHVKPDKIIIEGSSAGGHLAASYGMFWSSDFVLDKLGASKEMLRPAGMILNYPVTVTPRSS